MKRQCRRLERGRRLIFDSPLCILPPLFLFHYSHLSLSLSIHHPVRLPLPLSNDARGLSFRSVDALTLISVINWGALLRSLALRHPLWSSSMPPLSLLSLFTPLFLFSSSFHQTLAPLSHLHSLNQLLSTHPCDPISFHPTPHYHHHHLYLFLSVSRCLSHLPRLPSDHPASMNRWPTWSNLTLWLTERHCSKWGYGPHALSLSITFSSHAKSCSRYPFVSGLSDRRREQIRHQKTRYRGASISPGCHPADCAAVVTGDLPQTANVAPEEDLKSFNLVSRPLKQYVSIISLMPLFFHIGWGINHDI